MKYRRGKLLGFMLTLALVIGLLPVMSLTACAAMDQNKTFKAGDKIHSGFPMEWIRFGDENNTSQLVDDCTIQSITYNETSGKWVVSVTGEEDPVSLSYPSQTGKVFVGLKWASTSGNPTTNGYYQLTAVYEDAPTVAVTGVSLNKDSATLTVGGMETLTATVSPDNATDKTVTWTTDNATVATVANGVVTAVGKGTATITATATNGTNDTADDFTATCTVTVHAHSFTYSVDGATITATCSSEGCPLTGNKATLTITAPTAGGGAAVLSGDVSAFGVSGADIKYAVKNGSTWGEETSTAPSGSGFFKASITVSKDTTASVTYGVSAITVASGIEHGSITAPSVATVDAVVPLTITPEIGYELDELRPTKTNGGGLISVHTDDDDNKSFIMPDEGVTVTATFKLRNYKISFDITSGSITVPETAKMNETVIIIISPDEGYGVYSFDIPGVDNLELVSKDTDTGVEIYTFTMPYQDITVNVELRETTIYTIETVQ